MSPRGRKRWLGIQLHLPLLFVLPPLSTMVFSFLLNFEDVERQQVSILRGQLGPTEYTHRYKKRSRVWGDDKNVKNDGLSAANGARCDLADPTATKTGSSPINTEEPRQERATRATVRGAAPKASSKVFSHRPYHSPTVPSQRVRQQGPPTDAGCTDRQANLRLRFHLLAAASSSASFFSSLLVVGLAVRQSDSALRSFAPLSHRATRYGPNRRRHFSSCSLHCIVLLSGVC